MSLSRESAAKWLKLDAVCDQFESDCTGGSVPKIESYLAALPPEELGDAIRELLKLELHYRQKAGAAADATEIKTRFPGLDSVWLQDQLNPTARSSVSRRDQLNGRPSRDRLQDRKYWPVLPGFEILEVLGRGGMGIVYKARQVHLGRVVALKMIRVGDLASSDTVERFRAESRTLAQLQHPNLVQVFEVGEDQGRMYLVFEFVEGGSLDKRLNGVPQLAKPTAKLIRSLAYATQYAHTRSIVHRDLKPANILLENRTNSNLNRDHKDHTSSRPSQLRSMFSGTLPESSGTGKPTESQHAEIPGEVNGDYGEPKITDFGLAKHLEEDVSQTRSGMIIGSPCYMSPEQATGNSDCVGIGTDVYSLGAIMYEMLTGRPPFRAPTVAETLRQLQEMEPVAPRLIQPTVPRDLETICLKCLSKEVERRYESAGALADDLDRFLRDEPVLARPVTYAERTWRWCVRHPLVSMLTAILLLVMFGGTPILAWKWNEADHHRRLAESHAEQFRLERDTAKQLRESAESNLQRAEDQEKLSRRQLYLRRIGQAYGEWQSNLVGSAAQRLEECPNDLRGWEWRHLNSLCHAEYLTLRGHESEVGCLKYSNDGRTIVSGTGVLGGSRDGVAMIWDARTGTPKYELQGHEGSIHDVAMTPTGSKIVTASSGNVKIWNAQGEQTQSLPNDVRSIFAVALTRNGKQLATGGFQWPIKIWDTDTGALIKTLEGHTGNVFDLAFSPNGNVLYSASIDGTIRIWDVKTGQQSKQSPLKTTGPVYSLALSPDGRYLAYPQQKTIYVVDLSSKTLRAIPYRFECDFINSLSFSPEGRRIVFSSIDGSVIFMDLRTGMELRRLHAHDGAVNAVAVGDAGRKVATAGLDRLIKVWNASTDGPSADFKLYPLANRGLVRKIAITGNGHRMLFVSEVNPAAYASGLNDLVVVNLNQRAKNGSHGVQVLKGHSLWLTDVATTTDGEWYATSSADCTVRIWNAQTLSCERVLEGHKSKVTCVEFSRDGQFLATGDENGKVIVWNRVTGLQQIQLDRHSGPVNNVAFNDDGQVLASAGEDGNILLWNPMTGQSNDVSLKHDGAVTSVTFSHKGDLLASSGRDRTVRVWDGKTFEPIHVLLGHAADVLDVAFSKDDQRLGSASADYSVKLWDPTFGDETFTIRSNRTMFTLAFHPDEKRLFAANLSAIWCFSTDRTSTESDEDSLRMTENLAWHRDQFCDALRDLRFTSAEFHIVSYAKDFLRLKFFKTNATVFARSLVHSKDN